MEKFKNYKEKQAYYRDKANKINMLWVSSPPNYVKDRSKRILKGSTYIKPKEGK